MKQDKYREIKETLAVYVAERAQTQKWIEDEYRPKFDASTLPDKVWLDAVVFREEFHQAEDAFRAACTPELIALLLEEKGLTEDPDFWVSYPSVKDAIQFLEDHTSMIPEERQRAHQMLTFWGDQL